MIRPQPGPQEAFLATSADIAIFGGSAGGGKTFVLLLETSRHIDNPDFGAVTFRRESPQITNEGGLWDESAKLFPLLGATPIYSAPMQWIFPSGAKETFTHLQHEKDVLNWQGAQIPLIKFDELTHFTRKQFFYMLSRNRSTCGVRPYIRATCNPDPDSWVAELIAWYLDEKGFPIKARSGVIRWFAVINDIMRWADTREALVKQYGPECEPKSFTFIASSIYDNKILLEKDPGYLANLKALPLEEQMRLLHGNWKFKSEGGLVKRSQLIHLKPGEKAPDMVRVVVALDPTGSATSKSDEVGIIVAGKGVDGRGYVMDDLSGVLTAEQWANRAVNAYNYYGADCIIGERNYGGDLVKRNILAVDRSVNYKDVVASRGKMVRWEPVAACYQRGEITHCKHFDRLENQICSYHPETFDKSPDRLDANVWAFTELLLLSNHSGQTKLRGH